MQYNNQVPTSHNANRIIYWSKLYIAITFAELLYSDGPFPKFGICIPPDATYRNLNEWDKRCYCHSYRKNKLIKQGDLRVRSNLQLWHEIWVTQFESHKSKDAPTSHSFIWRIRIGGSHCMPCLCHSCL